MSLTNVFKSLHPTRILLTEVSRGKRNALLKKLINLFDEFFPDKRYKMAIDLLKDQGVVEDLFNSMGVDGKYRIDGAYESWLKDEAERQGVDIQQVQAQHIVLPSMIFLFKHFEEIDPTGNMKYGNWLIDKVCDHFITWGYFGHNMTVNAVTNAKTLFNRRGVFFEDYPKFANYLKHYDEMKRKNELPDEYRDINQLPDTLEYMSNSGAKTKTSNPIEMIKHITKEHRTLSEKDVFKAIDNNLKEGKDYKILGKDVDGYNVYVPLTQKANSIMGMDTEWCTTYGEHCTNPDYQDRSPMEYDDLIILINVNNSEDKYQFHFKSNQFMNADDYPISNLYKFLEDHPNILRVILEEFDEIDSESFVNEYIFEIIGDKLDTAPILTLRERIIKKYLGDNIDTDNSLDLFTKLFIELKNKGGVIDVLIEEGQLPKDYRGYEYKDYILLAGNDVLDKELNELITSETMKPLYLQQRRTAYILLLDK